MGLGSRFGNLSFGDLWLIRVWGIVRSGAAAPPAAGDDDDDDDEDGEE